MPGVGEKGASQLLQKYGSLDDVLDHASEQTPKRREALTEHADDARKTRDLAVIRTDAPVELDLADVPPLDFGPERMRRACASSSSASSSAAWCGAWTSWRDGAAPTAAAAPGRGDPRR